MYSNTKTLAAIAVASLVDKGIMDYEDRITKVKKKGNDRENGKIAFFLRFGRNSARTGRVMSGLKTF